MAPKPEKMAKFIGDAAPTAFVAGSGFVVGAMVMRRTKLNYALRGVLAGTAEILAGLALGPYMPRTGTGLICGGITLAMSGGVAQIEKTLFMQSASSDRANLGANTPGQLTQGPAPTLTQNPQQSAPQGIGAGPDQGLWARFPR